jgi:peptidyl-prolyl cis-trans isomerase SurA
MKKIFTIVLVAVSFQLIAQQKPEVLFTINKEKFYTSEFKSVYEKNLALLVDDKQKDIENYLDLFVNFKLKVFEAKRLQLDTTRSYKREIATYKNQLIAPYLQDSTFLAKLINDAYHRTKYKVNASHILVKLPKNYTPKDTLNAYQKIINARKEILSGVTFAKVATKFSDDPSVKSNLGNLGYFTAFKMVYPFENAVYTTKVGEVSKPFRTRFGYHIVKVNDKQLSEGEIEVAHILLTDRTTTGKVKVDSIYNALLNGSSFEQLVLKYSNDKGTVSNGGKLPKFGVGRMFKDFEDKAFELKNEGQYSKPFLTQYGWHIIKLLKKYPVISFEKMKKELSIKVRESGGAKMSDQMMLNKLKKKYIIKVNKIAYKTFEKKNIRAAKRDSLNQFILTINSKNIRQSNFFDYIRNRRHKKTDVLFEEFINQEVLNYFKENLVFTEPTFANTLKEYEEGLLVFDLMQTKVWNKASTDSLGLQTYFKNNIKNYTFTKISENKGKVMNDYQEYLESQMINQLKEKYPVSIRKRGVKKLIKHYQTSK